MEQFKITCDIPYPAMVERDPQDTDRVYTVSKAEVGRTLASLADELNDLAIGEAPIMVEIMRVS